MKRRNCGKCGKRKWTRRHHDANWTCQRCIHKTRTGRATKRAFTH